LKRGDQKKTPPEIAVKNLGQEEVSRIGTVIGENLVSGLTVALYGQLGAGKTYMIKAICEGLGVMEPVTSPTFTIVNNYEGRFPVFHVDLYRMTGEGDLLDLGLEEMTGGEGICLFEWPEKASDYLDSPRLDIEIEWASPMERHIRFTFIGNEIWSRIIEAISKLVDSLNE
jgi:tRNA threonylcarbamoyladenosine biosynthesis protein TsaE